LGWNEPYNFQNTLDISSTPTRVINLPQQYRPGSGDLLVFLNGVLARRDIDYREINNYTIEFLEDLVEGDTIFFQLQKLW